MFVKPLFKLNRTLNHSHKKKPWFGNTDRLICSGDFFHLKIPQSDWQKAFWRVSQEQDFYQTYIMYRNTANNIYFHYRTNSVEIKDYFFNKLKKTPIFGPILTYFPSVWS